ncbi:MAG: glycosyltransferase [Chloroflexi bacterium]|nr:glycosyltransferase [Chloroflexota bacterium]
MRILFLSSWFPWPPDNGSKIRIYNLLRALSLQHEVTLLSFTSETMPPDTGALVAYCHIGGIVPQATFNPLGLRALAGFFSSRPRSVVDTYSREMATLVRQEIERGSYHLVIASQLATAPYIFSSASPPAILEEVELSILREAYRHAGNKLARFQRWLTWGKNRRYIAATTKRFAAVTVVSELEKANLQNAIPGYNSIFVVPNGVDVDRLRPGVAEAQPQKLVFNGALTYRANYDAMAFFLNDIWPLILAQEPTVRLDITGSTDGVLLPRLAVTPGVIFTGYLPDIRPAVSAAWACIVPLRVGGGTRLKILEAMALGTPVISTSKGAEGLDVTPEMQILIADDPAQFADQTIRLLRDPQLRQRLSQNGRRLVEDQYDWRLIGDRFNALVASVGRTWSSALC